MIIHSPINVLFMASEADPLVKVGGLGDVAGSLPKALRTVGASQELLPSGLDIRLVIPFHPAIRKKNYQFSNIAAFKIDAISAQLPVKAYQVNLDNLTVYLIDGPPIARETGVYSTNLEEDAYKYIFFSLAALMLPRWLGWKPDIIHANDWHASAAVYALALNRPTDPFYRHTSSLLTVHNLPYLGSMTSAAFRDFDLPPAQNTALPDWASHMALPLGLLAADSIVAVSPGYAREIMTPEFSSGLDAFLRSQSYKITGILNGLDVERWNPATDTALSSNFSLDDLLSRTANKTFLQGQLGLRVDPKIPLVAMVTRMDPQKGVDLAVDGIRLLLHASINDIRPFQVVFLGTGDPLLEQAVRLLAQDYSTQVCAQITYDEQLSRHIYAGADMLLMPSRYEPCGLSQMIAMRYGCVPVARATGGLSDTIQDPSETRMSTGFLFKPARPEALADAILRAFSVYTRTPQEWQQMQLRGMQQDFSWNQSAMRYLKQYKNMLESRIDVE